MILPTQDIPWFYKMPPPPSREVALGRRKLEKEERGGEEMLRTENGKEKNTSRAGLPAAFRDWFPSLPKHRASLGSILVASAPLILFGDKLRRSAP